MLGGWGRNINLSRDLMEEEKEPQFPSLLPPWPCLGEEQIGAGHEAVWLLRPFGKDPPRLVPFILPSFWSGVAAGQQGCHLVGGEGGEVRRKGPILPMVSDYLSSCFCRESVLPESTAGGTGVTPAGGLCLVGFLLRIVQTLWARSSPSALWDKFMVAPLHDPGVTGGGDKTQTCLLEGHGVTMVKSCSPSPP